MRVRALLSLLFIAAVAVCTFVAAQEVAASSPRHDLAGYWDAAHLAPRNPYSLQLVKDFEGSENSATPPTMVKNPPWAIVFVLPLALLSYPSAFAFWTVLSIVIIVGCARVAWGLYSTEPSLAPALLCLLYGPTILLLRLGQITVLVLLGITLFLFGIERKRDWLAGASLMLLLLKPHVTLFFLLAALLWAFQRKRWAMLLSGALALVAVSIAALVVNPHIFSQYLEFATQFVSEAEIYPNLGGVLVLATGHHGWAILPEILGAVWFAYYWRKHREEWNWHSDGMLALMVSVVSSYHSYPYDEILFLPALMAAFASGNRRIFLTGFVTANLGYAFFLSKLAQHLGFGGQCLWWTASCWLITYVSSRKQQRSLSSTANIREISTSDDARQWQDAA